MNRAAIYARYSSDLQSAASIEDQIRICERLVMARGLTVAGSYTDAGLSGATHLRPGFQRLLADIRERRFDVIVAESLDRISRDQEHIAGFYKQAGFAGIRIVTQAEGEISELHIGLKGTMGALYLKDLAQKTHRGLEGRVRSGKSAGGISYGYRVDRHLTADGAFTTGARTIALTEAAVVERIFRDFAAGRSPRRIAGDLNAEAIRGPGGKAWGASTIYGNWRRGTGVLNNELYVGKLVWNRQRFVKDPATGKRQARPNPPEAWITEEVPVLRIVDDELWNAVKARQTAIRREMAPSKGNRLGSARRPVHLLSGLLRCGCCGASYTLVGGASYGCAAARNKGTCGNRLTIPKSRLEERVLGGLRDHLLHPELIAEFVAEYQREYNRLKQSDAAARAETECELSVVERQIVRIIDAIAEGMFHPGMKAKMDDLESRRVALSTRLTEIGAEADPVRLHPGLVEIYQARIAALTEALNLPESRAEAAEILRSLIEEVRLVPEDGAHAIELVGALAGILALGSDAKAPRSGARGALSGSVVAGAGFEPAAFRL